jgi:hypothetical protein
MWMKGKVKISGLVHAQLLIAEFNQVGKSSRIGIPVTTAIVFQHGELIRSLRHGSERKKQNEEEQRKLHTRKYPKKTTNTFSSAVDNSNATFPSLQEHFTFCCVLGVWNFRMKTEKTILWYGIAQL